MQILRTVLVVTERSGGGGLADGTPAALGAAAFLAEGLGWSVLAAVAAARGSDIAERLGTWGVHVAAQICPPHGAEAPLRPSLAGVLALAREFLPCAVIIPHTSSGHELAVRLAVRLRCDLVVACTSIRLQDRQVTLTVGSEAGEHGEPVLWNAPPSRLPVMPRSATFWMPAPITFWDPMDSVVITVAAGDFPPPIRPPACPRVIVRQDAIEQVPA